MAGEQFSLVWNSFPTNLSSGLYSLLSDEHLVDVTLAAEGKILRAHKLILSVCSTYFRDLFKGNNCKHPIVILKDVNYRDLYAMLQFMYQGEVNIQQEDISSFLKVAETLQIKGLTKDRNENKEPSDELAAELLRSGLKSEIDEIPEPPEAADLLEEFPRPFDHLSASQRDLPSNNSPEILTSSSVTFQISPGSHIQSETDAPGVRPIFNDNYMSAERIPCDDIEPLDFTSDMHQKPKEKPLDYRYGMGSSTSGPQGNSESDRQTPIEGISYQSDYGEEPPGVQDNNGDFSKNLPYDSSQQKSSKGRRTVKGIPHSTLPLETTLRVVSELGPTLRVERGKVVRMYSCPWCLRHFTRKENLKLHVRYIHGPLESLTCKLCGNKYKNSNSLRVHSYLYHNTKRSKHNKPLVPSNI
ncbi:zinc finger and BTB domain-containing protein 17-like [Fopius arisanus]|uniref:Zinc finger and BTB domain-containing protein 17-like n=1 Tax=Fopius arisanus TaxID=64838 RepID=A0A9R1U789_9HYME|nr:PREDICTED: zinc finger and BTB domain-containing protein 17-like [Fopius arisanus]